MKRFFAILVGLMLATSSGVPPIFRLHVIANSDSQADQEVKLEVRDAIITELGEMGGAQNSAQAEQYAQQHIQEMIDTANRVLKEHGFTYEASAEIGTYSFPEKTYGDTTLPEGEYRALRIKLGQAEGQNWWCVLFPPLCLLEPTQTSEDWQPSEGVTYTSFFASLFQ